MSIIVSIFKKELIDVLRDRRTLMFMVVIPILITPLLIIGSIKFQEYQNKKSEEKILKIAYINESEDSLAKQLLSDQKGVKIIGIGNVMNKLPLTASNLYAKNIFNFVRNLYSKEKKQFVINMEDEIIKNTLIKESN